MKIIVAATDFSKNGNNAVEYSAALAREFGAKLFLVHVYVTIPKKESDPSETEEELKLEIRQKLILLSDRLNAEHKIVIEAHLLSGESVDGSINKFADKIQSELIVIGTSGTNLLERLVMGSTTSKLIHSGHCADICIPQNSRFKSIKRIAFATDLKEDNINAANSLVTFAKHFDAEICFLFVDDKDLVHDEKMIDDVTSRIRNRIRYNKISGYLTKHTDIKKGIHNLLKQLEVQALAMYTHSESYKGRFSQSITSIMAADTTIPLIVVKKGTLSII